MSITLQHQRFVRVNADDTRPDSPQNSDNGSPERPQRLYSEKAYTPQCLVLLPGNLDDNRKLLHQEEIRQVFNGLDKIEPEPSENRFDVMRRAASKAYDYFETHRRKSASKERQSFKVYLRITVALFKDATKQVTLHEHLSSSLLLYESDTTHLPQVDIDFLQHKLTGGFASAKDRYWEPLHRNNTRILSSFLFDIITLVPNLQM